MQTIAKDLASEHLLIANREQSKVVVLANAEISYSCNTARIVALPPRGQLDKVLNYYVDASAKIQRIVIDSVQSLKQSVYAMEKNFFTHQCPVLDLSTGREWCPKRNNTDYLLHLYGIAPSEKYLDIIAKSLCQQLPLMANNAEEVVQKYISRTDPLYQKLVLVIRHRLESHKQYVIECMTPSSKYHLKEVNSLGDINVQEEFMSHSTLVIQAATGVGKTKNLFSPLARNAGENNRVVYISHLIALVEQFCGHNKALSYSKASVWQIEKAQKIGIVINSIYKEALLSAIANCQVLIIDEFEKVLNSIVCADDNPLMRRNQVLESLLYILQRVPKVIVGDADISEISLQFLSEVRSDLQFIKCRENPYLEMSANICEKSDFLNNHVKSRLFQDKVFLFDSVQTLKQTVKNLGYTNKDGLYCEKAALDDGVLVIHGDNKGLPEQQLFLANPNTEIPKYRAIMASPCLGSGFSITERFTNRVTVICDKTLTPLEVLNFSRRFRAAKEIIFAVENKVQHMKYEHCFQQTQPWVNWMSMFEQRKYKLNATLALSLQLTLEDLGFTVQVTQTQFAQIKENRQKQRLETKEYKNCLIDAILKADHLDKEVAKMKIKSNLITSNDEPALIRSTILKYYQLTVINKDDVEFHFSFSNRHIFKYLPCVFCAEDIESMQEVNSLYHDTAQIIHTTLFKNYMFDEPKSSLFIEQESLISLVEKLSRQANLLNHALDLNTLIRAVDTQHKASRIIRPLLKSLGFEMGPISPGKKKARISMTPRAQCYRNYIKRKHIQDNLLRSLSKSA